ncbi:MAG: hypothetical protein COT92_02300 [Candidatus Doudnabacteria bacterium CG10_big_fil_rev_8_21_14_0_10_42_18]|uniref:Glucosamine/galactosamine-6-phosphate isomerase domain-containing protein n=1 Tax=Candidatus Doudnabacteria bacterium CG10_big_fil_rev_8_21_14_0_10_42_18 TaxID=1974552 RepID=A0A2H0VAS4_9BACT|nr:MAG: hypothetical protein COT92_02300 [Candidatus Doudnabacteria bacterium CG10_big_fil_rev_8_21_14_0_10_42_18]
MIHKFETKEEASAAAGQSLHSLLDDNKDKPVLLLLSGGSAFSLLEYVGEAGLSENVAITMLDERFSHEATINNFLRFQQTDFYKRALENGCAFIGTLPREGELIDDMKIRWELSLKNWKRENPEGKIFATFGIGPDGHTAGIFPYPQTAGFFKEAFENRHLVTAYLAKGKHEHEQRLTTTFTFFKLIDEAIVFVCGENKKEAFNKFIKGRGQPHELPALGIYETKNQQIFTDIVSS